MRRLYKFVLPLTVYEAEKLMHNAVNRYEHTRYVYYRRYLVLTYPEWLRLFVFSSIWIP